MLVNRIPPEDEAGLLLGERECVASSGGAEVLIAPVEDLPTERVLGENEVALVVALPGGADEVRLQQVNLGLVGLNQVVNILVALVASQNGGVELVEVRDGESPPIGC